MRLAIINKETNVVENVAVPPEGSDAFFVPEGYLGVLAEVVEIGDRYTKGKIISLNPPAVEETKQEEQAVPLTEPVEAPKDAALDASDLV